MAMTAQQKREARAAARAAKAAEKAAKEAAEASPTEQLNAASIANPETVRSAHGVEKPKGSAGAKVTVACKIGVGWFQLQLCRLDTVDEQTQTGVRQVKKWTRTGQIVRVRGTAYPRGTPPEGFPERPQMIHGAALTPGIDKDFWDQWVEQNRLNPVVVNGLIFAHEAPADIAAQAAELKDVTSGLDPINPKGDKRMPKSSRPDVSNVATEETHASRIDRAVAAAVGRG